MSQGQGGTAVATAAATAVQQHNIEKANSFAEDLALYRPNLIQALPPNIPVERFERVLITAVGSNPDLLYANRRTLFLESVKCAVDGLLPDGREAALVIFKTTVKQRDAAGVQREFEIEAVKYMPMLQGIRKRMRNTGEVLTATAEVVHRNDTFAYSLGDDPFIRHEPAALGEDAGEAIGAYAIIRLKSGEVLRDVMDRKAIELSHAQSRARKSLMWDKFTDEAWKKTVLRRCSKAAPQSAENEVLRLLGRDDEPLLLPPGDEVAALPAPDPEPKRPNGGGVVDEMPDLRPEFTVLDLDHNPHVVRSGERARDMILQVLQEAARQGIDQLNGAWEGNMATAEQLARDGYPEEGIEVAQEFDHLREQLTNRPAQAREATPSPVSAGPGSERPGAEAIPAGVEGEASRRGGEAQGSGSADPPNTAAKAESASGAPAAPTAALPEERPFPGDIPARSGPEVKVAEEVATERMEDQTLAPVMRSGKPDWRTWTVAKFTPKLKQIRDRDRLAFFLGDNDEHLQQALKAISAADRKDVEEAITAQQKFVDGANGTSA